MNRYTTKGFKYESDTPMARLQELEDKIEDGVLIEPPCKVGDTIYFVCGYNIAEYEVYKIEYDFCLFRIYSENPSYVIEHREFVFFNTLIGHTVFLTKEEAERKAKGE